MEKAINRLGLTDEERAINYTNENGAVRLQNFVTMTQLWD